MMHRITPRIQEICDAGGTSAKERSQKPPKVQFCPMPIYNPSSNPNSMLGHPFKLPGATYITPPHRAPIYAGVKPQNFAQALKDQKSTLLSARLGIANFSSVKASHPSLQSRKKPKMPPVDPKEETPCRKRKRAPKRPKISRKSSERQIRFSTYTPPVAKPQESITAPRNSGMSRASSPVHPLLDLLSNPIRNDLYHPARPPLSWYPRNPNASATTPSSTPHAKAGVGTTLQHSTSPLVQDHLPSSKFPVFANPSTWDAKRVAHENALRQRMTENTARYEGIKKDGSTSQNLPPPAIQTRPPPLMTKNQHLPSIVVKNYAKPVVATLPKPNIVFSGHEPSSSLPVPTKIKEVAPLPDLPSFPFLQEDSDMPDLSYLHSFSSCTDASLLKQDAPISRPSSPDDSLPDNSIPGTPPLYADDSLPATPPLYTEQSPLANSPPKSVPMRFSTPEIQDVPVESDRTSSPKADLLPATEEPGTPLSLGAAREVHSFEKAPAPTLTPPNHNAPSAAPLSAFVLWRR